MNKVNGFTLIELLLAIFILVFVLSGLLHVFNHCLALSTQSANIVTATAEAYSILEEIRVHNYGDIMGDYNGSTFPLPELNGSSTVNTSYVGSTNFELLQVSVTVNYTEKSNRAMSLTLTTLIADRF